MRSKQFDQIERCSHPHSQGILKLLPCAFIQPLHQRQSIVDYEIHLAKIVNNLFDKGFHHLLLRDVANEVFALANIDDLHRSSPIAKLLSNTSSDAMSTASHDSYLILVFHICC